ncbi:MAG: hypothetical protein CL609_08025 [Anaerolineaceae bacterium]|nr:hypothetical protein [Anaerolineaceae bacterium]
MFENYALGVDVSHWQPSLDWMLLAENGVDFAWVKAAQGAYGRDPSLTGHLKGAKTAGLITAVYHWFDPTNTAAAQLENLKHALDGLEFSMLALDVEQYWLDWREWQQGAVKRRVPDRQISERALALAELARDWCQKPVVIYTRASFVAEYAPHMKTWLVNWPLWLAMYPYPSGRVSLSWQTLKNNYAPPVPGPALPGGCTDWTFWQFSGDKFLLPGSQTALDLNFFNGSRRQLYDWLQQPMPAEVLSMEEKVRRLWLAHPVLWQEEVQDVRKDKQQSPAA